jgi:NitT/TauT family transport system permease protein/sulfonate transport system permease protein
MFHSAHLLDKTKSNFEKIIWGLIAIILFVVLWYSVSKFTIRSLIPSPVDVITSFFKSFVVPIGSHTLVGHIGWSLYRVLVGYILGSFIGIVLGIAMGWNRIIRAIFSPIFEMLRPIPPLAWIPLSILWFGIGEQAKYFIIFIAAVVPAILNSYAGTVRVDPLLVGAGRMLGANTRQIFTKVVLPSCVPSIFAGLQVGLSNSWAAVLAAEMVRSSNGVGWMIVIGEQNGDMTEVLVGMVSIALVGWILINIMRGVEDKLCAWNQREK